MNKRSKYLLTFLQSLITTILLLSAPLTRAENANAQRKILPYIEASETLNLLGTYPFIEWIASDQILFGSHRLFGDKIQDWVKQVAIYNTTTKFTLKNIDLSLYMEELDYQKNRYIDNKNCFNDYSASPTLPNVRIFRHLKPKHGCISIEYSTESIHKQSFNYVLSDKSKVNIPAAWYEEIGSSAWIQWLQLYVLNQSVPDCNSSDKSICTTTKVWLMTPDGKLSSFDIGGLNYIYIRPTRAGLLASFYYDGLFILHEGVRYKVAEGYVTDIEVAPDGCQVAFAVGNYADELQTSKLRVVNVCKGFKIAKNTNPFKLN